jgi:hypothetical protein
MVKGAVKAFGAKSGPPTGTLATANCNTWVWAIGDDWLKSINRTVGPG